MTLSLRLSGAYSSILDELDIDDLRKSSRADVSAMVEELSQHENSGTIETAETLDGLKSLCLKKLLKGKSLEDFSVLFKKISGFSSRESGLNRKDYTWILERYRVASQLSCTSLVTMLELLETQSGPTVYQEWGGIPYPVHELNKLEQSLCQEVFELDLGFKSVREVHEVYGRILTLASRTVPDDAETRLPNFAVEDTLMRPHNVRQKLKEPI